MILLILNIESFTEHQKAFVNGLYCMSMTLPPEETFTGNTIMNPDRLVMKVTGEGNPISENSIQSARNFEWSTALLKILHVFRCWNFTKNLMFLFMPL